LGNSRGIDVTDCLGRSALKALRRIQRPLAKSRILVVLILPMLSLMVLVFVAVAVAGAAKDSNPFFGAFIVPFVIGLLAVIIPNFAVQVPLLHDQERSAG
jgi:uncharacterized membrane protein YhaH (DUF805 family)